MQRMRTPLTVMAVLGVALYGLWLVTEDGGTEPAPAAAAIPVIAERVEALRDLRFEQIPRPVTVTPEQARREGLSDLDRNYPPERLRADEEILKLLGLIDEDADLRDLAGSLFGEGVAGYYDPRDGRLRVVEGAGTGNRVLEEMVLAHELTHALEDQRFGLPQTPATDDRSLARAALHEGTATALMTAYIQEHFSAEEALGGLLGSAFEDTGDLPPFMEAQVLFPYVGGERFAGHLLRRAGGRWNLVDTAYELRPPASTEQVLHPRAYLRADEPLPVRLRARAVLGDGWRRATAGTWGELQTRELLGSARAAAGWGGDRYELWRSDGDRALIMRWRWDTPRDVAEFEQRLRGDGPRRGGPPRRARDAGGGARAARRTSGGARVTGRLDRRALGVLAGGHLCVDLCQGAVPALLPFLAAERGYSYAALGALVLFSTIGSSIIQPLFGLLSDRIAQPWLMPGGLVLAGVGIALAGPAPSYGLTALAVVVSGLGVAAFHPEGAKFAGLASFERKGRGMSLFSVGGNAGFALGPLLTTPLVLVFGLSGTLALVVFPLAAAVLTAREIGRLRGLEEARPPAPAGAGEDDWGAFSRLGGLIALRSGVYFGLQAFIPAYFVVELSSSEAAGNAALTIMLAAGAVGTLVGGGLVDRWGGRAVLVGTQLLLLPLLVVLPLAGAAPATIVLGLVGFVTIASFSITIILGQAYLPNRMGLASGVTLGLAIGLGGVAATALGVIADAAGLHAVLWTIAVLPLPSIALAFSLPSVPPAALPAQPEVLQRREPGDDDGLERDPHLADGVGGERVER